MMKEPDVFVPGAILRVNHLTGLGLCRPDCFCDGDQILGCEFLLLAEHNELVTVMAVREYVFSDASRYVRLMLLSSMHVRSGCLWCIESYARNCLRPVHA